MLEHIVQWCALANMHCIQVNDVAVAMHALTDGDAVSDVREAVALGAGSLYLPQKCQQLVCQVPLASMGERWMRRCLASFVHPPGLALPVTPQRRKPPAYTEIFFNAIDREHYLRLVCANGSCGLTCITFQFPYESDCYRWAERMGWWKSPKANWKQSRCPVCVRAGKMS